MPLGRSTHHHAPFAGATARSVVRRTSVIAVASVLVASSMLAACGSDDPSSSSEASSSVSEQPTATEEPTVSGSDVGFEASGEIGDRPVLTFDGDTPPSGLQVSAVTEGDGEVVAPGSQVTVNYYGAVWGSQEPFDNSYDRGQSTSFGLNQVITGWTVGLEGQRVGSRVLITIPPDLGYGPSGGNGSIGAEDTIVFVVDILGTVGPDVTGQADATPTGAEVPVTWEGGARRARHLRRGRRRDAGTDRARRDGPRRGHRRSARRERRGELPVHAHHLGQRRQREHLARSGRSRAAVRGGRFRLGVRLADRGSGRFPHPAADPRERGGGDHHDRPRRRSRCEHPGRSLTRNPRCS